MDPSTAYGIISQAFNEVPRICHAMNVQESICRDNTVKIVFIISSVVALVYMSHWIYNIIHYIIKEKQSETRSKRAGETRASTDEMKDFAKSVATILYAVGVEPKVKVDNIKLQISRYSLTPTPSFTIISYLHLLSSLPSFTIINTFIYYHHHLHLLSSTPNAWIFYFYLFPRLMPLTQERMGIISSPSSDDIINEYSTPILDSEVECVEVDTLPPIQKKSSYVKDRKSSPRRYRNSSPRRSKASP